MGLFNFCFNFCKMIYHHFVIVVFPADAAHLSSLGEKEIQRMYKTFTKSVTLFLIVFMLLFNRS